MPQVLGMHVDHVFQNIGAHIIALDGDKFTVALSKVTAFGHRLQSPVHIVCVYLTCLVRTLVKGRHAQCRSNVWGILNSEVFYTC